MLNFQLFEVGGLGRAASPRPPRRAIDSVVSGIAHARILHAKSAKDAEGVIFNFGFFIFSRIRGTRSRADSSRKGRKGRKGRKWNTGGRDEWVQGIIIFNTGVLLRAVNTAKE